MPNGIQIQKVIVMAYGIVDAIIITILDGIGWLLDAITMTMA